MSFWKKAASGDAACSGAELASQPGADLLSTKTTPRRHTANGAAGTPAAGPALRLEEELGRALQVGQGQSDPGVRNQRGSKPMQGGYQYIDGVGNVSVVNGMAHIDLVVVQPPAAEGQQAQVGAVQHLVMALPNFVRLCAEMGGHLRRMEEKGLITKRSS